MEAGETVKVEALSGALMVTWEGSSSRLEFEREYIEVGRA